MCIFILYYLTIQHTPTVKKITRQKYNIDIESMLFIPGKIHIFWKDLNGFYLGTNDCMAETAKLSSKENIIGKDDYDLIWNNGAAIYKKNDAFVIKTKQTLQCKETATLHDKTLHGFTIKTPLYNQNNKILGVFGITCFLNNDNFISTLNNLKTHGLPIKNKTHADSKNNAYKYHDLSQRQSECLYHLVRGKTAKQIAKILNLSYRTVEDYFETLKLKFNCHNKPELIAKAIDMGFGNI